MSITFQEKSTEQAQPTNNEQGEEGEEKVENM
jgi:hypothetical protein